MDRNQIIFIEFFKKWVSGNWPGNQTALAKFLGVSIGQVSNLLTGQRGGHETTRIKICNKIGVDYRSLIETSPPHPKKQSGTGKYPQNNDTVQEQNNVFQLSYRKKSTLDKSRLEVMQNNLKAIYDSGDIGFISAIEANLVSFREAVELKKVVEKQGKQLEIQDRELKAVSDRIKRLE